MQPLLTTWCLLTGVLSGFGLPEPGTQFVFRGEVAQIQDTGEPAAPEKRFDLTLLVAEGDDSGIDLYWWLDESGRGAWNWSEHFGRATVDRRGQSSMPGPSLWYDHGETSNVLAVPFPLIEVGAALEAGAIWSEGDALVYSVQQPATIDGRETFRVQVSDKYGRKRQVWLASGEPVAAAWAERVFMLMGTEFELSLRLISSERLPPEIAAREIQRCSELVELRSAIGRPARSQQAEWTAEQLALLKQRLPKLLAEIDSGPLQRIVRAAEPRLAVTKWSRRRSCPHCGGTRGKPGRSVSTGRTRARGVERGGSDR